MKKNISIVYHSSSKHIDLVIQSIVFGIKIQGDFDVILFDVEKNSDFELISNSECIIFGSPTYFGSISGKLKSFFDTSGQVWMKKVWTNKIAAGFTNSGNLSGDKFCTITQILTFAMQHGMIWVGLDKIGNEKLPSELVLKLQLSSPTVNRLGCWTGLMTQSDRNIEEVNEIDINTAKYFGYRIALLTSQIKK